MGAGTTTAYALTLEEKTIVYDSYALEKAGSLDKSIEKMNLIYQRNPNDYFVNLRLGWLFFIDKKYKNSEDHYERAFKSDAESIEPLLGLSTLYLATAAYDKVVKVSLIVLKKDPANYKVLQSFITSEIRLKNYKYALTYANWALKLYPTDPVFLEQRAYVVQESGMSKELLPETLSLLLLVSPENAYARSQLNSALK